MIVGEHEFRRNSKGEWEAPYMGGWGKVSRIREVAMLDEIEKLRGETLSLADLQKEAGRFGDRILPNRTAYNALIKLMIEELPELISGGYNQPEEFADAIILLLDVAYLQKIDVQAAVIEKMRVNYTRRWKIDPNTGLAHHVKGE